MIYNGYIFINNTELPKLKDKWQVGSWSRSGNVLTSTDDSPQTLMNRMILIGDILRSQGIGVFNLRIERVLYDGILNIDHIGVPKV